MSKSYAEFMDEITPDELYEELMAYGFFYNEYPKHLPTPLWQRPYLRHTQRNRWFHPLFQLL